MSSIWSRMVSLIPQNGFNVTKCISNSKELLISIPADKMRPGVKDLNLLGDVQVGKPLGIQWNIA